MIETIDTSLAINKTIPMTDNTDPQMINIPGIFVCSFMTILFR